MDGGAGACGSSSSTGGRTFLLGPVCVAFSAHNFSQTIFLQLPLATKLVKIHTACRMPRSIGKNVHPSHSIAASCFGTPDLSYRVQLGPRIFFERKRAAILL